MQTIQEKRFRVQPVEKLPNLIFVKCLYRCSSDQRKNIHSQASTSWLSHKNEPTDSCGVLPMYEKWQALRPPNMLWWG